MPSRAFGGMTMTAHVSAFGRALCKVGTDAPGTGDVLVPSDQATCPACLNRLTTKEA